MPKPLEAGRLRHRVRFERPVNAQDPVSGSMTRTWEPVATVAAAIEPLSVRDYVAAQSVQSRVTTRIVVRYRPGLTADMRLVDTATATTYTLVGLLPDADSGREYITCVCTTQGSTNA